MSAEAQTDRLLELTFSTDNPRAREICEAYWTCTPEGQFPEKITELAKRLGVTKKYVNDLVVAACYATYPECTCRKCGVVTGIFTRRYQFEGVYNVLHNRHWSYVDTDDYFLCGRCHEADQLAQIEEARTAKEEQERHRREAIREAFDNGVYQSLDPLEFTFLVHLASCDSWEEARRRVGIAPKDAHKLLDKLAEMYLIELAYNSADDDYERPQRRRDFYVIMLPELVEVLRNEIPQRCVKSIFSPKSIEVFKRLKRQHAFVFPEIPICAFVDEARVKHLFEQGEFSYFLTCRVDFLICEQDGTPKAAVEFQGGYHADPQQAKRDAFKKRILSAVGLPLTTVTSSELKSEGALPDA